MARAARTRPAPPEPAGSRLIAKLSSSLGVRDESANRSLADELARGADAEDVAELVALCSHAKVAVRRDAAKAVAALAGRVPQLVLPHVASFGALLEAREGVIVWSTMEALSRVAACEQRAAYALLPQILRAADCGSVIARDHAVRLLVTFAADPKKRARVLSPLLRILRTCPVLQLPMYAELALAAVPPRRREEFVAAIRGRSAELSRPSALERVNEALRRVGR